MDDYDDIEIKREQYYVLGNIDGLFSDDRDIQFYQMLKEEIEVAVEKFSPLQRYVINHTFGLKGCEVQSRYQIASDLNFTHPAQVDGVKRGALFRLKKSQRIQGLRKK